MEHPYIAEGLQSLVVAIDDLHEDQANARVNHAIERIAASLRQYGQRKPIVVNRLQGNKIEAGNGTFRAAKSLGWSHIAAIFVNDDPATAAAFGIADNRVAELSAWDPDVLSELTGTVGDLFTGFEPAELADLLGAKESGKGDDPGAELDQAEELLKKWKVEPGQIWLLGNHRLLCDDCSHPDVITHLLQGEKVSLLVSDPPYGVKYDPAWRIEAGIHASSGRLGKVENDDQADWSTALAAFNAPVMYVWHAALMADKVISGLRKFKYEPISHIVWAKDHFVLSRGDYHWQHEACWYVVKEGEKHNWQGARDQATVWQIPRVNVNEDALGHGTQKPLECMERPIRNNSSVGQVVVDPFCGSGTTLIGCERLGRICRAVEIAPKYVAVILERWAKMTGKTPTLEEYDDGRTQT